MSGLLLKALLSGGSMLLSVFTYAQFYGWRYAVGFVALILVHEMGHYLAARQRGLDVGLPTFIPFVGAWINLKTSDLDAETTAFVGMAGPLFGSTAAFGVFLLAMHTQSSWLMALAYTGFALNLFNLIPLSPLDGGHIVGVISQKLWLIGLPLLVGLYLWRPNPLLILIGVMAVFRLWGALKGRVPEAGPSLQAGERWRYGAQYLGLVALLIFMVVEANPAAIGREFA